LISQSSRSVLRPIVHDLRGFQQLHRATPFRGPLSARLLLLCDSKTYRCISSTEFASLKVKGSCLPLNSLFPGGFLRYFPSPHNIAASDDLIPLSVSLRRLFFFFFLRKVAGSLLSSRFHNSSFCLIEYAGYYTFRKYLVSLFPHPVEILLRYSPPRASLLCLLSPFYYETSQVK